VALSTALLATLTQPSKHFLLHCQELGSDNGLSFVVQVKVLERIFEYGCLPLRSLSRVVG
jgi:hypothetical protein